jgi:hypothetical protein
MASFHQGLTWLSEDIPLPDEVVSAIIGMRDVSREIAGARRSDSAVNRVRRLEAAAEGLEALRLRPAAFGSALADWSTIVSAELDRAYRQLREEEPIPQVYAGDGRPIRPARRSELAPPFKGRQTLFRRLETDLGGSVGQRSTLLLYGQRRTGKTSALLHLPDRLGSDVIPAFLDMESPKLGGANNEVGLLRGLASVVVEETQRHRGARLPTLDREALSRDPYPAFGRWLDRVERALGDRTLLLCLDEFEELERAIAQGRLDDRILSTLRNIVQHHPSITVLLSGSHQIGELSPRWASTLISTTTLPISFLAEEDARELIERPVDGFPSIYADAAVARIVALTHCQPFLIQLTCALLVERMNASGRMPPESVVNPADVEAVVPLALERGHNYFDDLWRNQTGRDAARRLLIALAGSPDHRMDREAIRALALSEGELREAIATLVRREIIERVGDGYQIIVPLIAAYVRRQDFI